MSCLKRKKFLASFYVVFNTLSFVFWIGPIKRNVEWIILWSSLDWCGFKVLYFLKEKWTKVLFSWLDDMSFYYSNWNIFIISVQFEWNQIFNETDIKGLCTRQVYHIIVFTFEMKMLIYISERVDKINLKSLIVLYWKYSKSGHKGSFEVKLAKFELYYKIRNEYKETILLITVSAKITLISQTLCQNEAYKN